MFKLILLGLSAISHTAIGSAHVCDCVDRLPDLSEHLYHVWAAGGYLVLSLISVGLLARHLVVGSSSGPDKDVEGE